MWSAVRRGLSFQNMQMKSSLGQCNGSVLTYFQGAEFDIKFISS